MTPALDHAQGWTPAGLGKPVKRRLGKPASVIAHDQFQCPARLAKDGRVHCRGRSMPRTFYPIRKAASSHLCDRRAGAPLLPAPARRHSHVAHEGRIGSLCFRRPAQFLRDLSGARCLRVHEHFDCQVSYRSERHSYRSSSSAVFDDRDRDREAEGSVPNPSGEFPK